MIQFYRIHTKSFESKILINSHALQILYLVKKDSQIYHTKSVRQNFVISITKIFR